MCMVMTPFVYLWFNAELREDLMGLFRNKRTVSSYASAGLNAPKVSPLNSSADLNLNGSTAMNSTQESPLAASLAAQLATDMSVSRN
uniref:Uncharacterized protein n=1 Tax=Acrobeloides nanus TaxID=290746 RepID=A0A914CED4_9BILA